jgi:hypothetical protein
MLDFFSNLNCTHYNIEVKLKLELWGDRLIQLLVTLRGSTTQ